MRVESPSSPRERCSVNTVRRSIISMRYLNFIKKDEKHIPHFRRTELFPSGGGKPEGKVGEQYSPRDVHSISPSSTPYPPIGCCMSARITPKQTGTGLNPTENTFGGDPEKNVHSRTHSSELNICAPMPHRRCGPRLDPVPVSFNTFLVREGGGATFPFQRTCTLFHV